MRSFITVLFLLVGCTGEEPAQTSTSTCEDITRELTVGVPFSWAVMDDEEHSLMNNGCTLTTITHYVLDDGSSGGSGAVGGGLPFGYYERQCQWDACGGPLPDRNSLVSNPVESMMTHDK